jgi:hypothetical protein
MNATLSKALVALVPAGILFIGSVLLFLRERTLGSFLQPIGAGCLVVVVLAHICEALHLFPACFSKIGCMGDGKITSVPAQQ